MAGYPKIWTTILHEPWFVELSCLQRGIWLQVILHAKEQTDNGILTFRNLSHFASELSCNRRSIEAWLDRESGKNRAEIAPRSPQDRPKIDARLTQDRVRIYQKCKKLLRFEIVNYNNSQQVSRLRDLKKGVVTKPNLNIKKYSVLKNAGGKNGQC